MTRLVFELLFQSRRRTTSPSLREKRAAEPDSSRGQTAARDFDSAELENYPEIIRDKETIARFLDGQGWPA